MWQGLFQVKYRAHYNPISGMWHLIIDIISALCSQFSSWLGVCKVNKSPHGEWTFNKRLCKSSELFNEIIHNGPVFKYTGLGKECRPRSDCLDDHEGSASIRGQLITKLISKEGSKPEILSKIAKPTAVLSRRKIMWRDKNISLASKVKLMWMLILSTFLYACEGWTLTAEIEKRIQALEML